MRISHSHRRTRRPAVRPLFHQPRRSALCVFELILWFPVFLMFLLSVIEFGLIFGQLKQVAVASRAGAKVAAESLPISMTAIQDAVDHQLQSAGIGSSCNIVLVHNVPGGGASPQTTGTCDCNTPFGPTLPAGTLLGGGGSSGSVRVTVCVRLTQLSPDFLNTLGFSIANFNAEHTTTYVHEQP